MTPPAGTVSSVSGTARRAGRDLLRAASRRRWLLSGGLAAAAVATALPLLSPTPQAGTTVLAAAHDLSAGTPVAPADLRRVELPRGAVPDGALADPAAVTGQLLVGAVRRGEPLTDARLVGPGLLARLPGAADGSLVAVPVRLADPATTALLRPGDAVDVLAAAGGAPGADVPGAASGAGASASVVAAAAPVLAVPAAAGDTDGALVVLAAPPSTAARLAGAAVTSRLSVVVRP